MWVPALAAFATRLLTRQPVHRRRGTERFPHRRLVDPVLLLIPFLVGVPAYGAAVALDLVHLDAPPPGKTVGVVLAATMLNLILVPGEERGWRGFMVPRLVAAGAPAPLLTSGVIWGVWHIPLVVWGGFVLEGPSPWVSVVLLMVVTTTLGYVLAWQQLNTGSTWGPIAVHVVWNVLFQAVLEVSVTGDDEGLWLGEAGLLTMLALVAVVAWLARPGGRVSRDKLQSSPVRVHEVVAGLPERLQPIVP
jgi:uncharacterized protein